jgi:sugar phosphate isomerase/epimerase
MTQSDRSPFLLGALTLPYQRWSLDRALEGIARAGFQYCGIRPGHADGPLAPDRPTPGDYAALRRRIERHGLTPLLMMAHRASGDAGESLRRDIDLVAALGIPMLLIIPPSPAPKFADERLGEMAWFTQVEAWFRMMAPVAREAERRGVMLVLKPHGGIAGTGEDLRLIVERFGSPAVRVCYDPGNVVYYEGVRPEADLPSVAELVRAVCIKDHRGGQAVVDFPTPGDGDIDHASLFGVLRAAGFAGPCLIERIDGLTTPEEVDRALARGRAHLEAVAAAALATQEGA